MRFGFGRNNKANIDIGFGRIVGLDNIVLHQPVLLPAFALAVGHQGSKADLVCTVAVDKCLGKIVRQSSLGMGNRDVVRLPL